MWRSEVDVGIFGVVNTTTFTIRVIGSGKFIEVATGVGPGEDCETKNSDIECEEEK